MALIDKREAVRKVLSLWFDIKQTPEAASAIITAALAIDDMPDATDTNVGDKSDGTEDTGSVTSVNCAIGCATVWPSCICNRCANYCVWGKRSDCCEDYECPVAECPNFVQKKGAE